MGGQACVFYGAAEFSRGMDFAILATPAKMGGDNPAHGRKTANGFNPRAVTAAQIIAIEPDGSFPINRRF
jgi:hypothetical protein